jgi:hypothetical protein
VNTIDKHSNNYLYEDEISIKEIILKLRGWVNYLVSKWYIIVIIAIIGGIVGYAYTYTKKPTYTAELSFVLEGAGQGSGTGNYSGIASQFGLNMGGGGGQGVFEGENFLSLMKSRLMVEKALLTTIDVEGRKETLAEFYIKINNFREKWTEQNSKLKDVKFLPGANPSEFSIEQNSLITSFYKSLIVSNLVIEKQDKKSSIIALRVKSENELFSKYFAEILVKEASKFYVETKTKKSADNLRILQYQTDSIRRALNSSMFGVATSLDATPNPNSAKLVLRVPSQRMQGDVQSNQTMLIQLIQNLESAKISLRTETPLIQIIDKPVLPLLKIEANKFGSMFKWGLLSAFFAIFYLIFKKLLSDL